MSMIKKTPYLLTALFILIPSLSGMVTFADGGENEGISYAIVNRPVPGHDLLRTHWGDLPLEELEQNVPAYPSDLSSKYWLVQFDGPIEPIWRAELEVNGFRIISYFPDHAYIVDIRDNEPGSLVRSDHVVGAVPYLSGLKVSPELYPILNDHEARKERYGTSMLVVDLLNEDPSVEGKLRDAFPLVVKGSTTRFIVGPSTDDTSDLLALHPIEWIEPDHPIMLFNNVSKEIMGVSSAIQDIGLSGMGQKVAIADTGLDTGKDNHDINGDIMADFDNRVTFANWAGTSPDDTHSHGTHVAGSVAGNGSLSNGRIKGMAPMAEIFFQGIATDGGSLSIPSNTSLLFDQAYESSARVHTNSWGSSVNGQYTTRSWDVDWFMYTHPDMVILFSAGNSGIDWFPEDGKIDNDSLGSPATAMNCITVGASENLRTTGGYSASSWSIFMGYKWTGSSYVYQSKYPVDPVKTDRTSNDTRGLAAFSSRGPTDDLRIKPDVIAPGTNILSTRSSKTSSTGWGTFSGNSNYIFMGGTSMSTPITAGGVVLLREFFNVTLGMEKPTGALLKAALINGATDVSPGQYGTSTPSKIEVSSRPDNAQGWGRVNISESVIPKNGNLAFHDVQKGLVTGENFTTQFTVRSSSKELRLTLAWSDHPGTVSASKHLVNDLDLVLKTPSGTIHRGNDFISPYGDTRDSLNNVEGIRIVSPPTGVYVLTVHGYNVPMGEQKFAIVGSGDISNFSGVLKLDNGFYSTDGDRIGIELLDQDLIGEGTVQVNVSSTTFPKGKIVTLKEDTLTGLFAGEIFTANTSTSSSDHIQTSHDDTIMVVYRDSDPSYDFHANATAKRPERISVRFKPEYNLTFSTHEKLHLEGTGDVQIAAWWKFEGLSMAWRRFRDDGDGTFGDEDEDDGNYSDIWSTPEGLEGSYRLVILVEDHYLGPRSYPQFNISFDPFVPRFPKNLTFTVSPGGNSVDLSWDPTNDTEVSKYLVYMNGSIGGSVWPMQQEWYEIAEVKSIYNNHTVTNLTDGLEYTFRVSAQYADGNESSLSLWVRATPEDIEPPEVILLTTPRTIVGTISFKFTGSIDLEWVEIEYYNDSNKNGLKDDMGWMPAINGTPKGLLWDTTIVGGGPGDVDSMFLRFRGRDEVPNHSPWTEVEGFRIDNTGPRSVEIIDPPNRATNRSDVPLLGKAEGDGYVKIYLNGLEVANRTCNALGVFQFDLNLTEGHNSLLLSAFDLHGAGPTNRSYEFTLDTQTPRVFIDVGQETLLTREINWEGHSFVSTSVDLGTDENFTFIDNVTWSVQPPEDYRVFYYGTDELHLHFSELGTYNITLTVSDPAGNTNTTWVLVSVVDTTGPMVSIDGPSNVDEKTSRTYSINVSDNDPSWFIRDGATILWSLDGPDVQMSNNTQSTITVSFPLPGTYRLGLFIMDGGNNNGTASITIAAMDRTSPEGVIIGPAEVELGVPATFTCNVTDNDVDFPEGASFSWNLTYVDAPPDEIWSVVFQGTGFEYNFTEPGFYTLVLTVLDASGNELSIPLNIEAIGDLIDPTIIDHFPAEDPSFQFPENLRVSVTFSERMDVQSFTGTALTVVDGSGNEVNFTYELTDGTLLNIIPEVLEFGTVYTFTIGAGVTDLWGNEIGSSFSLSYRIRNFFEVVFPEGVFPSSINDNFTGNETGFYRINITFTNPVQVQSLIGAVTLIAYRTVLKDGSKRTEKEEVSDMTILPGDDIYSVVVLVQLDMGIRYDITISRDVRDVFDYPLDWEQKWSFMTYLPPDNRDNVPDPDDDDGIPDWLMDPTNWIIAAFVMIMIIVVIIVLMFVRRSTRKKRLERMWNETSEEGPRRRRSEPPSEPAPEPPAEDLLSESPPSVSGDLYEPKPVTMSYEELYGTNAPVPTAEPERTNGPTPFGVQESGEDQIPPPPTIDWDEDDEEEEDWEDGPENEESWDK